MYNKFNMNYLYDLISYLKNNYLQYPENIIFNKKIKDLKNEYNIKTHISTENYFQKPSQYKNLNTFSY